MASTVQYDMLEVLFFHEARSNPAQSLADLQEAVEPWFEVEPLEVLCGRQVLRIGASMGDRFDSAAELDAQLQDLAGGAFHWERIGAIRAGQMSTVRG